MPTEVRLAKKSDVPQVVALVCDVLAEFGLRFGDGSKTDSELLELPTSYSSHGGAFWVATAEGELVGTCGVFPVAAATFELRKMYLSPASRGRAVGKRLLAEALAWTRAHAGRRMVLDTTEQMTRAIAFYEANGFVRNDAEIRGCRCTRGYARDL